MLELFKHNSCKSYDGRSKLMIYRAGSEVYGRIWLSKTKGKLTFYIDCVGKYKYKVLIDDLFAYMRYERDCWRLQIDHAWFSNPQFY